MLVREILLQAQGESNNSVDEWVIFGGFFLMSHILLLLIQRCVGFRIQLKSPFNDIFFTRGMNSTDRCTRYHMNVVLLSLLTYHLVVFL